MVELIQILTVVSCPAINQWEVEMTGRERVAALVSDGSNVQQQMVTGSRAEID